MPNKTLPASTGYFNKKMLDILKKGETKSKASTTKTKTNKSK